jgi:hypothetical protein
MAGWRPAIAFRVDSDSIVFFISNFITRGIAENINLGLQFGCLDASGIQARKRRPIPAHGG